MESIFETEGQVESKRDTEDIVCAQVEQCAKELYIKLVVIAVEKEKCGRSFTCFPLARRMPPLTPEIASKTWNRDTRGKIDATSATTSGSSLNMYAHDDRKTRKSVLLSDVSRG